MNRTLYIFLLICLMTSFIREDPFRDSFYGFFICLATSIMCIVDFRKERGVDNIYIYYIFRVVSIIYILSFSYAAIKYLIL